MLRHHLVDYMMKWNGLDPDVSIVSVCTCYIMAAPAPGVVAFERTSISLQALVRAWQKKEPENFGRLHEMRLQAFCA
jgi:hypothetical protein